MYPSLIVLTIEKIRRANDRLFEKYASIVVNQAIIDSSCHREVQKFNRRSRLEVRWRHH